MSFDQLKNRIWDIREMSSGSKAPEMGREANSEKCGFDPVAVSPMSMLMPKEPAPHRDCTHRHAHQS